MLSISQHQIEFTYSRNLCSRHLQAEAKAGQTGGHIEAREVIVVGPMDIFAKRCQKLADLFTTIHQFSTLGQVCLWSNTIIKVTLCQQFCEVDTGA